MTAFDGDRVMAVFIGGSKRTNAATCGLKITYAAREIINAEIKRRWTKDPYVLSQTVGIDVSKHLVVRTGVRGSNDLVWVGRSANYAAKLCSLGGSSSSTIITADIYDQLNESAKYGGKNKENMWTKMTWAEKGITVYKSTWQWAV